MIDKTELACIYLFHTIPGVGNRTLWKIKEEFRHFSEVLGSEKNAWHGSSLSEPIQAAIAEARSQTDPLTLLEKLRADGN